MNTNITDIPESTLKELCDEILNYNTFDPLDYERFGIKRGLRNSDGSGVMAGISGVCSVEGYYIADGEKVSRDGCLSFRGINMSDIVEACRVEDRFGYEEVAWLLIFGSLPTQKQLDSFTKLLAANRELPEDFIEDMIMKAPSPNIMNKLARSVLALYSYDDNPDETSVANVLRQSIQILAKMPSIMACAYQVKRRNYYKKSMYIHPTKPDHTTAQAVLRSIRSDKQFTDAEAKMLDTCLMVHAEHGGGNNSTFATRVLTSSGTDTYSAIAAGIGALKGPKHGGANMKVSEMVNCMRETGLDPTNDGQVADCIRKIIRKELGDGSGLVYGMGHAIYTKSDPRAIILKDRAGAFAKGTDLEEDFILLDAIERLTPEVFASCKNNTKAMCANVDLYSGLVYRLLDIPEDLFTPIFTVARIAGWSAHRLEELITGGRIIRPAYKSMISPVPYVSINDR